MFLFWHIVRCIVSSTEKLRDLAACHGGKSFTNVAVCSTLYATGIECRGVTLVQDRKLLSIINWIIIIVSIFSFWVQFSVAFVVMSSFELCISSIIDILPWHSTYYKFFSVEWIWLYVPIVIPIWSPWQYQNLDFILFRTASQTVFCLTMLLTPCSCGCKCSA